MTSPPTAATAARSAQSPSRRDLSPRRSRRRRSTRCSARTWQGLKEWTLNAARRVEFFNSQSCSYDYIMILQYITYDDCHVYCPSLICFEICLIITIHDDDYQELWAPNIKYCISKRPNAHLKCRCWWDLLISWVGFEASLNSWGVWKSNVGKYRTIEYFCGVTIFQETHGDFNKKHIVGLDHTLEQQHAVPNSGIL